MILRRKFSPFMAMEIQPIASTPAKQGNWFDNFCENHLPTARLRRPIVRMLRGHKEQAAKSVRLIGLMRLRKGQLTRIRCHADTSIRLRLAHYAFTLRMTPNPSLTDQHGDTYELHRGKNYIGVASEDIAISARYAQMSPMHLIVEWQESGQLLLTDLSQRGTYLPPQCVL